MEISFINKVLRSMDKTEKRKAAEKTDKCDICGRMFSGVGRLKTHKTRLHKDDLQKPTLEKETVEVLTRSNSIHSESSLSPPPKKIFFAPKQIATAVLIDLAETETALSLANDPPPQSQVQQLLGGPALEEEVVPAIQVHQPQLAREIAGDLPLGGQDLSGEPALMGEPALQPAPGLEGPALEEQLAPSLQTEESALAGEPALKVQEPAPLLQGDGPGPMEGYDIEDNAIYKEEILELKTFIQTMRIQQAVKWREMEEEKFKNHLIFEKFKKESKIKYEAIMEEKEKIIEDMVKHQHENNLKTATLEAELKKVQTEMTLKSFRFEQDKQDDETDECIVSVKCLGNCDHISCRMQTLKLQGGRRTSPATNAEIRNIYRCLQCNFKATQKNEVERHVQNEHVLSPNCPFCQVGFSNLGALKKHIENNHKEVEDPIVRQSVIIQNTNSTPSSRKRLCIFHLQPQGCKKGQSCDFSHESNRQQNKIVKVRKVCQNGYSCAWKPCCRYVHPEDGETIPAWAPREGGRRSQAKPCYWSAEECPRGGPGSCSFPHTLQPSNQYFLSQQLSQPPPGYSGSLSSVTEFPGLPQVSRPSVFRRNPQSQ